MYSSTVKGPSEVVISTRVIVLAPGERDGRWGRVLKKERRSADTPLCRARKSPRKKKRERARARVLPCLDQPVQLNGTSALTANTAPLPPRVGRIGGGGLTNRGGAMSSGTPPDRQHASPRRPPPSKRARACPPAPVPPATPTRVVAGKRLARVRCALRTKATPPPTSALIVCPLPCLSLSQAHPPPSLFSLSFLPSWPTWPWPPPPRPAIPACLNARLAGGAAGAAGAAVEVAAVAVVGVAGEAAAARPPRQAARARPTRMPPKSR